MKVSKALKKGAVAKVVEDFVMKRGMPVSALPVPRNTRVAFVLTMPNRGSWNGRWSGENDCYCIVKRFGGKKGAARAAQLKGSYYYNFGDGWGANVAVKVVDASEARLLKRITKGFCGYDWMVESILTHGRIQT